MTDSKLDAIRSVPLFGGCSRGDLDEIAQLMDEVEVPAGKVLMRQGEAGSEMFVIVSGKVAIERDGKVIAERGPGTVIGEMSLLSEGPRTATVTTLEPSTLLVAAHREFHALMDDHPTLRLRVLDGLAAKIRVLDQASLH